ncbi:hypothetical protein [Roseomonas sp. BN140053]|uniref:hypothetical protein n=1 Tax=Roseomonas sp. BN140053 TaxID=3391898 RepID=UPI0039E98975
MTRFALPLLLLGAALPAAAQEAGWERLLPGVAPALAACLAGAPGSMVTAAVPLSGGRVLARVEARDGTRMDCVASGGTPPRVEDRRPVGAAPPFPGEGDRAFLLERNCPDARRIDGADGRPLGWLAYPACR